MLYRNREWKKALVRFEECLNMDPKDTPSKIFAVRCRQYMVNPPPEDWDGVYIALNK